MAFITNKPIQHQLGIASSGGNASPTITLDGVQYQLHIFTGTGNWTVTTAGYADIFLVAGGGACGSRSPGGAGAGGVVWQRSRYCAAQTYTFTIGAGGASGSGGGNYAANHGDDSVFAVNGGSTIFTAKGGGQGTHSNPAERTGGCAGGDSQNSTGVASATQRSQAGDSGVYGHGCHGDNGKRSEINSHGYRSSANTRVRQNGLRRNTQRETQSIYRLRPGPRLL